MLYRNLTRINPSYRPAYWAELRALYEGGEDLLGDSPEARATLQRLFPRHGAEEDAVYAERMRRAVYINYAAQVVGYIVAALCAEPVTMTAEPAAPPFYQDFQRSVDGRALSFNDLLRQQVTTALLTQTAWTLVDLPPRDDGAVIESEGDEEDVGQLRAFALPIEPECVLDWEETPSGDLEWALLCLRSQPRAGLEDDRSQVVERYTFYTRERWERYEVTYKVGRPPKPTADIPLTASGPHTFGRVPLARLQLPKGLWALNQIHNLAREHLNKRSSTSWSQYRHLFPILSAHLAPEVGAGGEIPAEAAQDPGRARNQVYGIGRLIELGDKDKLAYTSPDTGIYTTALQDLDGLRDEIFRVVHLMALAANNSAAALGRSGDSKAQDKAAATVVLAALGTLVRQHGLEIFDLARAGRRDAPLRWTPHGMQEFDVEALADAINEAAVVDTLKIPSPTFQRIRTFLTAKKIVKGQATPEQLDVIRKELEENITDEEFSAPPPPPPGLDGALPGGDQEPDGDEGDKPAEPADGDGDEKRPPPKAPPQRPAK